MTQSNLVLRYVLTYCLHCVIEDKKGDWELLPVPLCIFSLIFTDFGHSDPFKSG